MKRKMIYLIGVGFMFCFVNVNVKSQNVVPFVGSPQTPPTVSPAPVLTLVGVPIKEDIRIQCAADANRTLCDFMRALVSLNNTDVNNLMVGKFIIPDVNGNVIFPRPVTTTVGPGQN